MDQEDRMEQERENHRIRKYVALREACLEVSFLVEDYDEVISNYLADVAQVIGKKIAQILQ